MTTNTLTKTRPGVLGVAAVGACIAMMAIAANAQSITRAVVSSGFSNGKPTGVSKTFKTNTKTIHCYVSFAKPYQCTMRSAWYAVNAKGLKANSKVYELKLKKNNYASGHFSLTNNGAWPKGTYRVDVFANEKKIRSLPFSVK